MAQTLESVIIEHLVSDSVGPVEDLYAYVQSCIGKPNRINDYFIAQIDAIDFDNIAATVLELSHVEIPAPSYAERVLSSHATLKDFIMAFSMPTALPVKQMREAILTCNRNCSNIAKLLEMTDTGCFEFKTGSFDDTEYLAVVTTYAVTLIREGDKYRVGVFDCFLPSIDEKESFHSKACDSYEHALETFISWSQVAYKINQDEEDSALDNEDYEGPTLIDALELLPN